MNFSRQVLKDFAGFHLEQKVTKWGQMNWANSKEEQQPFWPRLCSFLVLPGCRIVFWPCSLNMTSNCCNGVAQIIYIYFRSFHIGCSPPPINFWIYFCCDFQCGNDHKCGQSNSLCLVESNIQRNVPQDRKSSSTSTKNARSSQPIEQSIIKQSIKIKAKFGSNKLIGGRSIDCPNE